MDSIKPCYVLVERLAFEKIKDLLPTVKPRRKPRIERPTRGKPSAAVLENLLKKPKRKPSKRKGKAVKSKVPSKGKSVRGGRAEAQVTTTSNTGPREFYSSVVEPTRLRVHEWEPDFLSAAEVENFLSNIENEACEAEIMEVDQDLLLNCDFYSVMSDLLINLNQ